MYHNFIFEETDGTKHFLKWNPTNIDFVTKERTTMPTLDGPPLVRLLDSTEAVGQMTWENAPRNHTEIYDSILALVGKTGTIHFNQMPSLVGHKNILPVSSYDPVLYTGEDYLDFACLVSRSAISDGSTLAPDGISMVWLWKRSASGGTGIGCIHTEHPDYTLAEHVVFSCYVKEDTAEEFGLNFYLSDHGGSNYAGFIWVDGVLTTNSKASVLEDYGVIDIGGGWYRPWIYINAASSGKPVGARVQVYIYPHYEASGEGFPQESTYVWGFQLEYGVASPTWYAHTTGQAITEPLLVEFLDLETRHANTYAVAHHDLILTFKVIGDYL